MRARQHALTTPEQYLEGELQSDVKHEYVAGIVYALAGASKRHNDVAGDVFAALHAQLRGKPCRPYNSDTKVRVRLRDEVRFYYPDAQITCQPNAPSQTFQDYPVVIVEVLSEGTHRIDAGEKRDVYLSLSSLSNYLLIESDEPLVIAYRRTDAGFVRETFSGLDATIELDVVEAMLRLRDIYDGVELRTGAER